MPGGVLIFLQKGAQKYRDYELLIYFLNPGMYIFLELRSARNHLSAAK
jgi:hypothetical protein